MKASQQEELDMVFDACMRTLSQNSDWLANIGDYYAEDASMEDLELLIEQELLAAADGAGCQVQSPKAPGHASAINSMTLFGLESYPSASGSGCAGPYGTDGNNSCSSADSGMSAAAHAKLLKLQQLQMQLGDVQKALASMSIAAGSFVSPSGHQMQSAWTASAYTPMQQ